MSRRGNFERLSDAAMKHVLELLNRDAPRSSSDRIPILWSDAHKERLRRIAAGEIAPRTVTDSALALSLLKCADGVFHEAEREILGLLRKNLSLCKNDDAIFISFIDALFTVQRFDVLAAMLRDRHGYSVEFELAVRHDGPGFHCVQWDISPSGGHCFTFDAKAYENDNTRIEILAFQWEFPLYAHYAQQTAQERGSIIINQADIGEAAGLAWCDSRPDRFLVPDCVFIPSRGYRYARQVFSRDPVPWHDRQPVALWRGVTTGVPSVPGDWRSLERIKLCELARQHEQRGLIDAGISSVVQFGAPSVAREVREAGLMRDPIPWENWNRYKYNIDIDGNSSPWSGLFQRLLTGSPVLKIESSRGLLQWFYDELVPWHSYIPVASDMSDLMDKISWLARNDTVAQRIGRNGREVAERLTYEREVGRSVAVISAAFRYFGGRPEGVGPYGRPLSGTSRA